MAGGRSSDFTPEIANEICDRLAKGESLRTICGDGRDDFIPHRATIIRWLGENEQFRDQYAHAREAQADHYAEEIVAIADCTDMQASPFDGSVPAVRDPQRDRLRIDARKWVASKLAPKRYGDKVALTGGGESDAPLQVIINKPA
jgi:hypothetical protein